MDTNKGYFKMVSEEEVSDIEKNHPDEKPKIFRVGEEVTIRQSRFRIVKITPKKITLRILPSKNEKNPQSE